MNRSILQIPLSKELRKEAEKQALEQGFSSLQEAVRVFLKKLADRMIKSRFEEEKIVKLSPRAEKRYEKIVKDIEAGRNVTKTKNIDELFELLRS